MPNPFDNPAAFAPFLTECVAYRGRPPARAHIAATLSACVLDCGYAEPVAEGDGSAVGLSEMSFPETAWPFVESPQKGDGVEWAGKRFSVVSVLRRFGKWTLRMKERGAAC